MTEAESSQKNCHAARGRQFYPFQLWWTTKHTTPNEFFYLNFKRYLLASFFHVSTHCLQSLLRFSSLRLSHPGLKVTSLTKHSVATHNRLPVLHFSNQTTENHEVLNSFASACRSLYGSDIIDNDGSYISLWHSSHKTKSYHSIWDGLLIVLITHWKFLTVYPVCYSGQT